MMALCLVTVELLALAAHHSVRYVPVHVFMSVYHFYVGRTKFKRTHLDHFMNKAVLFVR